MVLLHELTQALILAKNSLASTVATFFSSRYFMVKHFPNYLFAKQLLVKESDAASNVVHLSTYAKHDLYNADTLT